VRSPRVNIAIGKALEDRLIAHAEATGEGRSQIVRAALHAYLPELGD
jgi:predicted DNA-binding protein